MNDRSTWTSRLRRFGLRGFGSGCCAGCFIDVGTVVGVVGDSTKPAECVVGEK